MGCPRGSAPHESVPDGVSYILQCKANAPPGSTVRCRNHWDTQNQLHKQHLRIGTSVRQDMPGRNLKLFSMIHAVRTWIRHTKLFEVSLMRCYMPEYLVLSQIF